jgi:hypothetical protein
MVVQQKIKSYSYYALPLCVLFMEEKYHPWIYKEFIQIKSARKRNRYGDHLDYILRKQENVPFTHMYEEVMDIQFFPLQMISKQQNPIAWIQEYLANGYYVHLYMDEFYIKKKAVYQRTHLIHPSLLYGFDEVNQTFLAVGFINNRNLESFTVHFSEIDHALHYMFRKPAEYNYIGMYVYRVKPVSGEYSFTMDELLRILADYLNPKASDGDFVYGHHVYSVVIDNLKKSFIPRLYIKYNTIHFLSEHKNTFLKALQYVLPENESQLKQNFLKVVEVFDKLRYIYLTYNLRTNIKNFRRFTSSKYVGQLQDKIRFAAEIEKQVLTEIFQILHDKYKG